MKFPFKIPFIGDKTKLRYVYFEDDVFSNQYMIRVEGEFPESVVKGLYDFVLKKRMGVGFKAGLLDGDSVDVPASFFGQSVGLFSWEDVLLKQLDKVFFEVHRKQGIFCLTKHIQSMKITRNGIKYFIKLEIIGKNDRSVLKK